MPHTTNHTASEFNLKETKKKDLKQRNNRKKKLCDTRFQYQRTGILLLNYTQSMGLEK